MTYTSTPCLSHYSHTSVLFSFTSSVLAEVTSLNYTSLPIYLAFLRWTALATIFLKVGIYGKTGFKEFCKLVISWQVPSSVAYNCFSIWRFRAQSINSLIAPLDGLVPLLSNSMILSDQDFHTLVLPPQISLHYQNLLFAFFQHLYKVTCLLL